MKKSTRRPKGGYRGGFGPSMTLEAVRHRQRAKLHAEAPPRPEVCERVGCGKRAACLDHDHTTGKFRGWLCRSCNTAIGALGDNVDGLLNAIAYLRRGE